MALGDLPQFPRKYKPRGDKLVQKLLQNEISMNEIMGNIFSVLGKLTIDSSGIRITGKFGSFEIDSEFYAVMNDSIDLMNDYMMRMVLDFIKGRLSMIFKKREEHKLYLKFDKQIFGFKAHPLFVTWSRATEKEIEETKSPLIEILPTEKMLSGANPMLEVFKWHIGNYDLPSMSEYLDIKLYRIEGLVELFNMGWDDVGEMMSMIIPMTSLMSKEAMDKLGASYPAFWDDVLTKCGV